MKHSVDCNRAMDVRVGYGEPGLATLVVKEFTGEMVCTLNTPYLTRWTPSGLFNFSQFCRFVEFSFERRQVCSGDLQGSHKLFFVSLCDSIALQSPLRRKRAACSEQHPLDNLSRDGVRSSIFL